MENNEIRNGFEIDIRHILKVVWHRLWVILLAGILVGVVTWSYAHFMIPQTYSSSALMCVDNQYPGSPGYSSSQLEAAKILAKTNMDILRSRTVLEEAGKKAGLKYSYSQMRKMVTATANDETHLFTFTVTCENARDAHKLAVAIGEVLPGISEKALIGSSVSVIDEAVYNPNPVGPNENRYALMGFLLGATLALTAIVLTDVMDTTIRSEEFLTATYEEVPLLAVIPPINSNSSKYSNYAYKENRDNGAGGAK